MRRDPTKEAASLPVINYKRAKRPIHPEALTKQPAAPAQCQLRDRNKAARKPHHTGKRTYQLRR